MTKPKDHNNVPITNPKDMEFCDFPDIEFKISVSRNFNEYKKTQKTSQQKQENNTWTKFKKSLTELKS